MDSWRVGAACKDKHHDLLFPPFSDERSVPEHRYYDLGKMLCEHCPVRLKCAEAGHEEEWGLWGGRTPSERFNGQPFTPPPFKILPRYMDKIPNPTSERLDIVAAWLTVRKFADKRE
jgi:hypothetical protein